MIYKQNQTPLIVASKVTSEVKEEVDEELNCFVYQLDDVQKVSSKLVKSF